MTQRDTDDITLAGLSVVGLSKAFKKLRETKFIVWIPLWDIFYALCTPVMYYSVSKRDIEKW